jgi:hypothetical protein
VREGLKHHAEFTADQPQSYEKQSRCMQYQPERWGRKKWEMKEENESLRLNKWVTCEMKEHLCIMRKKGDKKKKRG